MEAIEYFSIVYVLLEQNKREAALQKANMEQEGGKTKIPPPTLKVKSFFPNRYLDSRSARTMFYKRSRDRFRLADDGFGGIALERNFGSGRKRKRAVEGKGAFIFDLVNH